MKVVILHYHLHPGGVTRVIESQITALRGIKDPPELFLITGDTNAKHLPPEVPCCIDDIFNYSGPKTDKGTCAGKVATMTSMIKKYLPRDGILHVHNPGLGKNPALTIAIFNLASEGYLIVNHCHDFPEDRPENMALLQEVIPFISGLPAEKVMYPDMGNVHFAVLNSRDLQRLLGFNIPVSRVHLMANPVALKAPESNTAADLVKNEVMQRLGLNSYKKICTYPVRGIQRKNLGEFILLAVLFSDSAQFIMTLPPVNPAELSGYGKWKSFCQNHGINIIFEAGEMINHEELIRISDFCMTTSIREGFGMVYLEPWLAGTPVIGRDLPIVTGDLRHSGLVFPRLYTCLMIQPPAMGKDFKDLGVNEQMQVILQVLHNREYREGLLQHNSFLKGFLDKVPLHIVRKNETIIKKRFSVEQYGKRLLAIYQEISG
jgi:glycosyltransferase involved in cell wall biosynthesis